MKTEKKEDEDAESDDDTAVVRISNTKKLQVFKHCEAAIAILDRNDPIWGRSLLSSVTKMLSLLDTANYKMKKTCHT
jgi:hypothetical protein